MHHAVNRNRKITQECGPGHLLFSLRLQPQLDQAADGFRPARQIVLLPTPTVDYLKCGDSKPDIDSLGFNRGPSPRFFSAINC
jgi:hypothetical protein